MKFERKDLIYFVMITLAVFGVWEYAVQLRLAYMDQIPVFDADVTTSTMVMWARGWLHEGAFHTWFTTPYSPLSIEAPTLESRVLYQSWPSLAVLPIYLVSILTGIEPSVSLVNWLNTVNNGIVALALAFAAYNLCAINKLNRVTSSLIAIATSFPVLLPRGLAYTFGQLYCVTTAIFPFLAICIFLETVFLRASTKRQRTLSSVLFFAVIMFAFLVDWSAYTFFAAWFCFRLIGGRLHYLPKWTFRQAMGVASLPFLSFIIYLVWRFGSPGSIARTSGISSSMEVLFSKFLNRINAGDSQISNFWKTFLDMHGSWFSPHVVYLLAAAAFLSGLILFISFKLNSDKDERKNIFILFGMGFLVTVPFYLHMIIFSQHTYIHRWAIAKVLFAYAFLPFVILPISLVIAARLIFKYYPRLNFIAVNYRWSSVLSGVLLGLLVIKSASISGSTYQPPYLMGRVDRETYLRYDTIYHNTNYADVVFSPIWEAPPIGTVVGVTNKRIYHIDSFNDIDKRVAKICGKYNVVIVMPDEKRINSFDGQKADKIINQNGVLFLRYSNYSGPKVGCQT